MSAPRPSLATDALLAALAAVDVTLAAWALASPRLWFAAFHGASYVDPEGLLPRMAANWAAFALFQLVALARWRKNPTWLAVAAGLRLSDIFTDWTYLAACHDVTWFGRAALLAASPLNVVAGWRLLRAHAAATRAAEPPAA
jgi:hypothetical protein